MRGAFEDYDAAVAKAPEKDHAWYLEQRGLARRAEGKLGGDEAQKMLQGALDDLLESNDGEALVERGAAHHDLGDRTSALADYTLALQSSLTAMQRVTCLRYRSDIFDQRDDYEASMKDLEEALQLAEADRFQGLLDLRAALAYAKGMALDKAGQKDEALAVYSACLLHAAAAPARDSHERFETTVSEWWGRLYLRRGDYYWQQSEQVKGLSAAKTKKVWKKNIYRSVPNPAYHKAHAELREKRDLAMRDFNAGLQGRQLTAEDADIPLLLLSRVWLRLADNDATGALADLDALFKSPRWEWDEWQAQAVLYQGHAYLKLEQFDEARKKAESVEQDFDLDENDEEQAERLLELIDAAENPEASTSKAVPKKRAKKSDWQRNKRPKELAAARRKVGPNDSQGE
jgi:tetratricopeptide (TPR) repeat protein